MFGPTCYGVVPMRHRPSVHWPHPLVAFAVDVPVFGYEFATLEIIAKKTNMRGTAIFTVPVGETSKIPVVCHLGGVRELSLNRVEDRPGTEGFRRDRLFQVDALVSRLANVFFFFRRWVGDIFSSFRALHFVRLAESQ